MRFLGSPSQTTNTEELLKRQAASQQSLAAGGLPLNAIDRLKEQAGRQGTPGHIFTSDLSIDELLTVGHAGFEPLGQVMGSSIYHVGWQYMPTYTWTSGELTVLTEAFYNARHLALSRIQQEAALLGATHVIGVRLEFRQYDWGVGLLEFAAIGTAIRLKGSSPAGNRLPALSAMTGEQFWLLHQSGYQPVGVAVGNCTWYQVAGWGTMMATGGSLWGTSWQNQEITDYTRAVYQSRSLASYRMELEGRSYGAEGIVGVVIQVNYDRREVEVNQGHREDLIVHFTAIGTAIARIDGVIHPIAIENSVSLRDPNE